MACAACKVVICSVKFRAAYTEEVQIREICANSHVAEELQNLGASDYAKVIDALETTGMSAQQRADCWTILMGLV